MPYCPKCGKEVEDGVSFCPNCGENLRNDVYHYRKEPSRWNPARIFMIMFGILFIIVSLGLLAGGGAVIMIERSFSDADDYLISRPIELTTDTYALIFSTPNIDVNVAIPNSWFIPAMDELISVKIIAESKNTNALFVGIATNQNLESFIGDLEYEEVTRILWNYDPWNEDIQDINYDYHIGDAPKGPPIYETFWEASDYGTDKVEFTWTPRSGNYILVVMNNDGSSNIDANIQFGIRLPAILSYIGYGLLSGGIIILIVGLFILYAARR